MRKLRQVGERKYQIVLRDKAAKESAISTENAKIDLTQCQDSEVDGDIDNTTASLVENLTGDQLGCCLLQDVLNFMSINVGKRETSQD